MFLRLWQTGELVRETKAIENAQLYIERAKRNAKQYSRSRDERCAFLCGNAGIYAVSAVVAHMAKHRDAQEQDLENFKSGFEACKPLSFNKYGSDELLVGRAGYLSGVYWLNKQISPAPFSDDCILEICTSIVESGRQYSNQTRSPIPLMYQYHGTEYLGAAHGLSSILHMLLESPWFRVGDNRIPNEYLTDIKNSIDAFAGEKNACLFYLKCRFNFTFLCVALQDAEGNFPSNVADARRCQPNKLIHWCHGAPGVIYLLIKAYLLFNDEKYLTACHRAADVIWHKGLLKKGPGICHGVAGSGYAFLILYRLTKDPKYLYRSIKFSEFLTHFTFTQQARVPDCPFSLYEGTAGTVCFLIDLLHPENACFPFMDVF